MIRMALRQSPQRTPTMARTFAILVALFSMGLGSSAQAQDLGEADVIRLAKAQDPGALVARAEIAMAKVAIEEAKIRKNPSLSVNHEHFPGDTGEAEDAIVLTLPIDLSNRRTSQKRLAESGVATASAAAARAQSAAVSRSLQLYYRLLAQKEALSIELASMTRLVDAVQIVKRQKEEGKVSGYDQIRIEIELEVRQSEQRQTSLRISQMQRELASLLGVQDVKATFTGSLEIVAAQQDTKPPPSLSFLRMAATHAAQARSATKKWLPTLQLSAGPRIGIGDDTRYGYVAGISVELPFYSKNESLQARARAQVSLTEARIRESEVVRKRQHTQAEEIMKAASAEARRFEEATSSRVDRLERAAASRYREGQSIIELLDAQRTRSQIGNRRLQLRLTAKEAEVSLRAARGEFE